MERGIANDQSGRIEKCVRNEIEQEEDKSHTCKVQGKALKLLATEAREHAPKAKETVLNRLHYWTCYYCISRCDLSFCWSLGVCSVE